MRILIKNGKTIDVKKRKIIPLDILIDNGKILRMENSLKEKADVELNAEDKIVAPGFIDMHAHLREPGREEVETIETALKAGVSGGFTTVCAMPNTDPPCDSQAHVKFLFNKAKETALANILPIGTITKKREGKEMSEIGELKEAGCLAISDDGSSVQDAVLLRRAMEYASMEDILVISHCEDKNLSGEGVMNEGYWSTVLGLEPMPALAESTIVERDIRLAELAGARLHIAHVSTAESIEIIRRAKKRGIQVTCEVTPHHFTLDDSSLKTYDTNLKVNPPLRSNKDIEALKKALEDGTIDVIATDHAPHLENEKEREFNYAPFGMIGLETALGLSVMGLIDKGYLDWLGLIEKLSYNPSRILKYPRGILEEGGIADIVIIDPDKKWTYTKETIKSKSTNSPFIGWELKGKVRDVIVEGNLIVRDEDIVSRTSDAM